MRIKTHLAAIALAAMSALGLASPAAAQSTTCGITGSSTATPAVFDPFNTTGLAPTNFTLNLRRVNGAGGQKTNIVNFYLKGQNAGSDGISIVPTSAVGPANFAGTGLNIFYNFAQAGPTVAPTSVNPTGANRFFKIEFTGNDNASDTVMVNFTVTLPANLDLTASADLKFDALFACSTTGGGQPTQQTGQITGAVTFPILVLSALQASYVGSALDFGEVGDKTTAEVTGAPATFTTPMMNHVRVQSSGPYSVELDSQNDYRLTFPGGDLGTSMQVLNYSLRFLGQTRTNVSPTFATVNCMRAGVPASEADMLTISATLLEGGSAKTPANNYSDILTVTVSPLLMAANQQTCPML